MISLPAQELCNNVFMKFKILVISLIIISFFSTLFLVSSIKGYNILSIFKKEKKEVIVEKTVQKTGGDSVEEIMENYANEYGGINKEGQREIEKLVNNQIDTEMDSMTPEEKQEYAEKQKNFSKVEEEINKIILMEKK